MSGNVWELCSDWYGTYSSNSQNNPQGSSSGSLNVYRGGSWYYPDSDCPNWARGYGTLDLGNNYLGFRLFLVP